MKQYEYKVVTAPLRKVVKILGENGRLGWRLVGFSGRTFIFEREIRIPL